MSGFTHPGDCNCSRCTPWHEMAVIREKREQMTAHRTDWWENTVREARQQAEHDYAQRRDPLVWNEAERLTFIDARIAKGIKAALEAVYGHTFYGITDPSYPNEVYDAAAITAFEEASR